jgi:hypothetical protein
VVLLVVVVTHAVERRAVRVAIEVRRPGLMEHLRAVVRKESGGRPGGLHAPDHWLKAP